ncbi:MAG: ABC transporter ATP-binding protein [Spirochaetaceae bacterium]|jgi:ABC-type oligopeptide transport system ATPase subunit|nr:ABC transporter ATP-binding protein [Spirochaetaceae bacterium]
MLLEVHNVSNTYKIYRGFGKKEGKPVLDRVTFDMSRGEILGILGESGCGKTTLGKCILGLIEYDGSIRIDNLRQGFLSKQRRELSRKVQAVFQDPGGSLNPARSIGWILEEPLKIHRLGSKQERIKKVDETLDLVGLESSYKTRAVQELSGGQRQRVSIACALMLEPKLIIADEAVSSLDVSLGAQILNLFQDLHQRIKMGLLFISHNLKAVYHLCGRIAVMYQGQIVEIGPAEAVYTAPAHPYTRLLLEPLAGLKPVTPWREGCRFAPQCPQKSQICITPPELSPVPSEPSHFARCWN